MNRSGTGWPRLVSLATFLALALGAHPRAEASLPQASYQDASATTTKPPAAFVFTPAPGKASVALPREERLVYQVGIDLTLWEAGVGKVTQTCTVAEQPVSLMLAGAVASGGEAASILLEAKGKYLGYELESSLETRLLPQEWPRILYQQRTESRRGERRREVMLGTRDGKPTSSYRGDTSKGAPPGTRIWRAERLRAVPEGTLDMLTAIFMARTLIRENHAELKFPLIDADRLWLLRLARGKEQRMKTGAGTFDVVQVVLEPQAYPGEAVDEDKEKRFSGVFGIQGSIHLWVEKKTGVAVRIQGTLPVGGEDGLIKIGIDVLLDGYSGTPPDFAPLPPPAKKR
ncbi:MAG TPA: DUF3108 domain-containing protein [Planctomycetota bacterium]